MARKASTSKRAVKKAKATTAAAARPTGSTDLRTVHHRVTVPRAHATAIMGMHHRSKLTHAATTAHFEVGYLTRLGPKGAALAQAILQNCERDYMTLQQVFGGLTPQRMPFVVQITTARQNVHRPITSIMGPPRRQAWCLSRDSTGSAMTGTR
jgi:hypothetical protein